MTDLPTIVAVTLVAIATLIIVIGIRHHHRHSRELGLILALVYFGVAIQATVAITAFAGITDDQTTITFWNAWARSYLSIIGVYALYRMVRDLQE